MASYKIATVGYAIDTKKVNSDGDSKISIIQNKDPNFTITGRKKQGISFFNLQALGGDIDRRTYTSPHDGNKLIQQRMIRNVHWTDIVSYLPKTASGELGTKYGENGNRGGAITLILT